MKRSVLIALALIVAGGIAGYNYLYKDHRDIAKENAALTVTADELVNYFTQNNENVVLNKTVEIRGIVSEVDRSDNAITIDNSIHCIFISLPDYIREGNELTVKGRCIGYDDLFEIVKLDQCSVPK
jgi:hypothetical protein